MTLKPVEALLCDAAATLIVPHWRRLRHGDATEKSPGEWVTVVDREVEAVVSAGLLRLIPDSVVVGEERCAAEPRWIDRASDFALYWRTLPWDHAPGTLFLTEAGGHAARLNGSAYRPGERRDGLLAARSRCLWDQAQALFMRARPPSETWRSAPGRSSS
jgi:fructose-1,6-bisphosphatase/inositol monophosphatase family enzyme